MNKTKQTNSNTKFNQSNPKRLQPWMQYILPIAGAFFIIRFFLRLLRDIDGFFSTVTAGLFKKNYKIAGACKKRGVCCQNIAIYLSDGFWKYPLLKMLAISWYQFVYNFSYKGFEPNHKVIVFSCNYLKNNGTCGIYKTRPFICRNYPVVRFFEKPELLPGCGYKIQKN